MKLNTFLPLAIVVALALGLIFVVAPEQALVWFGPGPNAGLWVTRLLGLSLAGYALLAWYAKEWVKRVMNRADISKSLIGLVGSVVDLLAMRKLPQAVRRRRRR